MIRRHRRIVRFLGVLVVALNADFAMAENLNHEDLQGDKLSSIICDTANDNCKPPPPPKPQESPDNDHLRTTIEPLFFLTFDYGQYIVNLPKWGERRMRT